MSVRTSATLPIYGGLQSSRLDTVLRAGQAHRAAAAATVPTGMPPPRPPPMKLTDLPDVLTQLVTMKLVAANDGKATSLCSDVGAWCRAHPVACRDTTMWRVAFLALLDWAYTVQVPDPNPSPSALAAAEAERAARRAERDEDPVWRLLDDPDHLDANPDSPPTIYMTVPNPEPAPSPAPYETYRDAFTNACMAIDQVRNGNPNAIQHVHPALLRSEEFMQNVAAVDVRVLYHAVGFDDPDREEMWRWAIVANPRNLEHARIYRYGGWGDISEELVQDILWDHPQILQHLPAEFDLDMVDWDLQGLLEEHPLWLEYMSGWFSDDECLMLKLAKKDGRSLQFMDDLWRSDKRIVLAALEEAGADVYQWVVGNALRRDPDVRTAAGLRPWPGQRRVRRNREEEESCTDNSESEGEEEPEEYDPNRSPPRGEPPMLPADYMPAGPPEGEWSDGSDGVEPAPSLRAIERQLREEEASSSEEEPESPTSTFDVKLKARNRDDSSSDEEDVSHGMDAGNVVMADAGEEGASPPLSPTRGDYPDYDRQRALDRSIATMREKRSWRNG